MPEVLNLAKRVGKTAPYGEKETGFIGLWLQNTELILDIT